MCLVLHIRLTRLLSLLKIVFFTHGNADANGDKISVRIETLENELVRPATENVKRLLEKFERN